MNSTKFEKEYHADFNKDGETEGWFKTNGDLVVKDGICSTKFLGIDGGVRRKFDVDLTQYKIHFEFRMRISSAVKLSVFAFHALGTEQDDKVYLTNNGSGDWQTFTGTWTPTTARQLTEIWINLIAAEDATGNSQEFDFINIDLERKKI